MANVTNNNKNIVLSNVLRQKKRPYAGIAITAAANISKCPSWLMLLFFSFASAINGMKLGCDEIVNSTDYSNTEVKHKNWSGLSSHLGNISIIHSTIMTQNTIETKEDWKKKISCTCHNLPSFRSMLGRCWFFKVGGVDVASTACRRLWWFPFEFLSLLTLPYPSISPNIIIANAMNNIMRKRQAVSMGKKILFIFQSLLISIDPHHKPKTTKSDAHRKVTVFSNFMSVWCGNILGSFNQRASPVTIYTLWLHIDN